MEEEGLGLLVVEAGRMGGGARAVRLTLAQVHLRVCILVLAMAVEVAVKIMSTAMAVMSVIVTLIGRIMGLGTIIMAITAKQ